MSNGINGILNLLISRPITGLLGMGLGAILFVFSHDYWVKFTPQDLMPFAGLGCCLIGASLGLALGSLVAWSRRQSRVWLVRPILKMHEERVRIKKQAAIRNAFESLTPDQKRFLEVKWLNAIAVHKFVAIRNAELRIALELEGLGLGEVIRRSFFIDEDAHRYLAQRPDLVRPKPDP